MGNLPFLSFQISLLLFIYFLPPFTASHAVNHQQSFIQCLKRSSIPANLIFAPTSKNYTTILFSSIQNPRTLINSPKPLLIITPTEESHVQSSVSCSKSLNVPLRIRSGGHDYEGLSYASTTAPGFIVIDLQRFRSIIIDPSVSTAWVQAGAILGELYYAIVMKSGVAAFPAGTSPTLGIGGHFGGGGLGTITRSHGLAIDNIIDARIVNANGDVVDRESMGEDLFWALRGGGGSFGVVLSYKIKLVQVPSKVTVFEVKKKLSNEGSIKLLSKYQQVAHNLDRRVNLEAFLQVVKEPNTNNIIQLTLNSLFLGEKEELVSIMKQSFPELELKTTDCIEMSWIESVMHFAKYSSSPPLTALLDRKPWFNNISFKSKSDILTEPIGEEGWREIFQWIIEEKVWHVIIIIDPLGGRVDDISETETPYPHRKGSLYVIQYLTYWSEQGNEETQRHLEWMRRFYEFMAPYVSKNPRGAYSNYRDLDLGVNEKGNESYEKASSDWGLKYFKGNFKRLVKVKSEADPTNLFRNEQSIPLLY